VKMDTLWFITFLDDDNDEGVLNGAFYTKLDEAKDDASQEDTESRLRIYGTNGEVYELNRTPIWTRIQ
jgi:hypothetical protein